MNFTVCTINYEVESNLAVFSIFHLATKNM